MKNKIVGIKFVGLALLLGGFMLCCNQEDPVPPIDQTDPVPAEPGDPMTPPVGQDSTGVGAVDADTISNHLRFFNAVKIQGTIPKGPTNSSLKISFKDTLHLLDEIKRPIKFLHEDPSQNVTGAYVQVHGGSAGTFYYDVPELPDMANNDSVSVIMIGLDPLDLIPTDGVPPAGSPTNFEITIVPHGENGQPLGQTTGPLQIDDPEINPASGTCWLVLPEGDYWLWDNTQVETGDGTGLSFYNDDDKKWGWGGQFINGCCINGVSSYNTNCAGNTDAQRPLKFPTWFWFVEERIQFFSNGEFQRYMPEVHVLPDPANSDFCGSGPGVVEWNESDTYYYGNWSVEQLAVPFYGDSAILQLLVTSTTGDGGYGRSGGIIHRLDCNVLVLILPDGEGGGSFSVSYFARIRTDDEDPNNVGWYVFS